MAGKAFGLAIAGMLLATAAHAQDFAATIVSELRAQGFREIETEQTWLGRTKIVASGTDGKREIVVNPNTGEILRDLWLMRNGSDGSGLVSSDGGSDDDRNDDNDDDSGDDNGGSSSGSSGGSGGGSGGGDSGGGNGGDSD